ncbi:MAG: tyrosine-type recombinase/integrase [Planctomycetes bacterium]|nr:tyrosine-type recombinase/integrase [Planctomycetota bacterium]
MKSTATAKSDKPAKPYPDFPLFPHATRRWAKKIRGKLVYFGPWSDPDAALKKYVDERDALHAGRKPRQESTGVTVRDVVNHFLETKESLKDNGEITPQTYQDYYSTAEYVVTKLGKERLADDIEGDDFAKLRRDLAKTLGPVALGNEIQRIRILFKHAYDAALIDKPMRYGPEFKRPSKKVLRIHRATKGPRMFEAAELKRLIDGAGVPLKAMLLLGINCGLGNHDCGMLPLKAVDLKGAWLAYPRPKTGINRRCPLWPETIEALQKAIAARPKTKTADTAGLLFLTKYGQPWAKSTSDNPIAKEMRKLLDELKLHRPGLGFYTLRHVFETIGGETRDQPAVDLIMGHAKDDMASHYRERISDERLQAVTAYVHAWLFPPKTKATKTTKTKAIRKPK